MKLRSTPVYAEVTNSASLSPPHSWPDSPPVDNVTTHISDDNWIPNVVDSARRHIFSANINLPDGGIIDFQKVRSKEINTIDVGIYINAKQKLLIYLEILQKFSSIFIRNFYFIFFKRFNQISAIIFISWHFLFLNSSF